MERRTFGKKLFYIILVLNLWILPASGTTYHIDHLSLGEGLSQSVVNSIVQDSLGFLWIGTQDGLNRYDGYSFSVLREDSQKSNGLNDSWINDIALDGGHGLWLATNTGINFLDLKENRIRIYCHQEGDTTTISSDKVQCLLRDTRGNLWIGTWGGGLDRLNPVTGKIIHYYPAVPSQEKLFITTLAEDSSGGIWVGTREGLYRVLPSGHVLEPVFLKHVAFTGDKPPFIASLMVDTKNRLWVGTGKGSFLLEPGSLSIIPFQYAPQEEWHLERKFISALLQDADGSIWMGTPEGELLRADSLHTTSRGKLSLRLHRFFPDSSQSCNSPPPGWILKLFRDRDGNIWLGTFGKGLYKISRSHMEFTILRHDPQNPNSLSQNLMRTIFEDSHHFIWMGTIGGGLNRYNPQTGEILRFQYQPNRPQGISSNFVFALAEDKPGFLFVATDQGIDYLDTHQFTFRHLFDRPEIRNQFPSTVVRTLYRDPQGYLWIGSQNGLRIMDLHTWEVRPIAGSHPLVKLLNEENIWLIQQDHTGHFWISIPNHGIFRITVSYPPGQFPKITEIQHFSVESPAPRRISCNMVLSFLESQKGIFWFGTTKGLNRYDPQTGKLTVFREEKGLTNQVINAILEDDSGAVWISTNAGIYRLKEGRPDQFGNIFQPIGIFEGLGRMEFNAGAYCKDHRGFLYFGSLEGVVFFDPRQLGGSSRTQPVVLTEIQVMGKPLQSNRNVSFLKSLTIPYRDKVISFEFSALDFTYPGKIMYAYKMEGFDRDWRMTRKRRFVNYTNLDPGEYTFRAHACDARGVWNHQGVALHLTIVPPFWMTWWFKVLVGLVLLALLYLLYRLRLQQLLALERLRVRIASNLHDDVGASLSRIAMYAELIRSGIEPTNLNNYLERISTLSREVTSTMSDIVWSIDARNDRIRNLLDRMYDFASQILEERQIDFQLHTRGLNPEKYLPVDLRQNIYLIFKEALNNVVKHSNATRVEVSLRNEHNQFTMIIRDNGTNFRHTRKSGHGLKNMKLRASSINATLQFQNEKGFTIILKRKAI